MFKRSYRRRTRIFLHTSAPHHSPYHLERILKALDLILVKHVFKHLRKEAFNHGNHLYLFPVRRASQLSQRKDG